MEGEGAKGVFALLIFLFNLHYQTKRKNMNMELYYQSVVFYARETICYFVGEARLDSRIQMCLSVTCFFVVEQKIIINISVRLAQSLRL